MRNFRVPLRSSPNQGDYPEEPAFSYEEMRATTGSCRELILKCFLQGHFCSFSCRFFPHLNGDGG